MANKIRPLGDRVVVQAMTQETSKSGIIIPDTAKEKPTQGKVVAVGPGRTLESGKVVPMDIQVGDTVLFGKWGGTEVKIDGVEYTILKEDDVYGVIS